MTVSSLTVARVRLASLIEAYAPPTRGREAAIGAFARVLREFEAAVREDEGAQTSASGRPLHELREAGPAAVPEVLPAPLGNEADAPADVQPEAPTLADMGKKKRK